MDSLRENMDARLTAEEKYYGEFRHDPTNLCPLFEELCPECNTRARELGIGNGT